MTKNFDLAKELFKDTIEPHLYFDSMSAEIALHKLEESIVQRSASLIFVIGEPGVGKTHVMRLINSKISQKQLTVFINHPFFDKRDLLKMLYEAKGLVFDKEVNFNTLKDNLLDAYTGIEHTIFIDEAQLLNEAQFELIRIMSDTKIFHFVIAMHKDEGLSILEKKHFKSRTKIVIEYGDLEEGEILRYIQSTLLSHAQGDIASMFGKSEARAIGRYAKGNFRTIKRFLYTLMKLLSYTQKQGLSKYQTINNCVLTMTALDTGLLRDT